MGDAASVRPQDNENHDQRDPIEEFCRLADVADSLDRHPAEAIDPHHHDDAEEALRGPVQPIHYEIR